MDYEVLNFEVKKQDLIILNPPTYDLVENSIHYLKGTVKFSPEWDGLYKVMVFHNVDEPYAISVDEEDLDEDGTFFVPFSAIKVPGFKVSCFGTTTKMQIDLNGRIISPEVQRRITTDILNVPLKISGPLTGITPPRTGKELNTYEISDLALRVAKEAYTVVWNMQYSLQEINKQLGTDMEKIHSVDRNSLNVENFVQSTHIKKDRFGIPIYDDKVDYVFEENQEGI